MVSFTTLASALAAAGAAVAAPATRSAPATNGTTPDIFSVMSLRSASPIHFGSLSASKGGLLLNSNANDTVSCASPRAENYVQLYIDDGELFLYSGNFDYAQKQQVFVDRSGMGQGVIGYQPTIAPFPRNSELKGWASTKDGEYSYLSFNDQTLQACPGAAGGAWSVWLAGVENPAGNEGCLGFTAMDLDVSHPIPCWYSQ